MESRRAFAEKRQPNFKGGMILPTATGCRPLRRPSRRQTSNVHISAQCEVNYGDH